MFRKTMIALAATVALGATALVPTAASAWGHHNGFHGFRGIGITLGAPFVSSCYQYQYVETRRGLRRMLVNVCGY